jgi:hypothetical protein
MSELVCAVGAFTKSWHAFGLSRHVITLCGKRMHGTRDARPGAGVNCPKCLKKLRAQA